MVLSILSFVIAIAAAQFLPLHSIISFIVWTALGTLALLYSLRRKSLALLFYCAGLFLGMSTAMADEKGMQSLPDKGFADSVMTITGFPRARPDGQYEVDSYSTKIISSNAVDLFKGDKVRVLGYASKYDLGGHFSAVIHASEVEVLQEGLPVFKIVREFQKYVDERIGKTGSPDIRLLLYTMMLGNVNFVDYSTSQSFRMTGVTHLLAISGMNVAIVAASLLLLLRLFLSERRALLISLVAVVGYVALAGFGASILRAGLMFLIYTVVKLAGRKVDIPYIVLLSAAIVLLFEPFLIRSPGFWLSYLAVLGIYYFVDIFKRPFEFMGKYLSGIMGTTFAASLSTLPFLLYSFKGISVVSPVANLALVPVFEIITPLVFIRFLLLICGLDNFIPLDIPLKILWSYCQIAADWLSFLPAAYQTVPGFPLYAMIAFYGAICVVPVIVSRWNYKRRLRRLSYFVDAVESK